MEKIIESLLLKNNSLIVPGFGSLIKSLSTGNITFNEFLKFNDGILEKELTSQGLSKQDASEKINAFIDKVKSDIEQNQAFALGSIGSFRKNEKGSIIFEGKVSKTAVPPPTPTPKPTVAPPIKKDEKSLNEKLAEKKPEEKSINEQHEKQETKVVSKSAEPKKEETKKETPPKEEKEKAQVISKPVTMSSNSGHGEHDENYVNLTQEEIEARHKKVALRGTIIFGILAIVVIAFFSYINPHHEHGEEGHGHGAATEEHGHDHGASGAMDEETAPAEMMEEGATEKSEAKEEANASSPTSGGNATASGDPANPAMEQNIPVTTINQKFYVVSAAFSDEKKAKHLARLLMIMDYKSVVISPESGKYYTCTGGYSNYQDAQKTLAEYKAKKADAWLYTP